MVSSERLSEVREAGLRRDYDHNGRQHYSTAEEGRAFESGLRESMQAKPIVETTWRLSTGGEVTVDFLLRLMDAGTPLSECEECQLVIVGGAATCPECGVATEVMDRDHLDDTAPYSVCECGYGFLWDDALGGGCEPGSHLCPKCGSLVP